MTTVQDLTQEHVDELLKAAQIDRQTAQQRYRSRVEDLQKYPPLTWHGIDGIVKLDGLAGEYYWPEYTLQPGKMTFTFNPGQVGSQGTYTLTTLLGIEQGVFKCMPNNPVIGIANIGLYPQAPGNPRFFTIDGMATDAGWTIYVLLLQKASSGPVSPPFVALRL